MTAKHPNVSNPFELGDEDNEIRTTNPFADTDYRNLVAATENYQGQRHKSPLTYHYHDDPFRNPDEELELHHIRDRDLPPQPVDALENDDRRFRYESFTPFKEPPTRFQRLKKILFGIRATGWPFFTYIITAIQIAVFIYELIKQGIYTKNPFQTKPYFNPMLGPSSYVQINVGARYLPCMTFVDGITNITTLQWPCPNSTDTDTNVCTLSELCGMGGISTDSESGLPNPDQWWRLITPMFIHAGIIHILFNLVLQILMGSKIERYIGSVRYGFIYLASGISGFLLGANFTPAGMASTGASGALFGACIALNLLLLIMNNSTRHHEISAKARTKRQFKIALLGSIFEIVIMLVLGLLPGLDNFSHIGGFVIGVVLGIALLDDPKHLYTKEYRAYLESKNETTARNIGSFFEIRVRNRVIIWYILRVVCLVLAVLYFVLLAKNFGDKGAGASESCKWCKYINCIPVNGWCELGDLSVTYSSAPFLFFQAMLTIVSGIFA